MDEIRIPNDATYAPVALTDLIAGAPLVSRLVLGATLPGRVISAAALGMYLGSALRDWLARQDVRWIDFEIQFGADVHFLQPTPDEVRRREIRRLAERMNDDFTAERIPRDELARQVNRHLTAYVASITGQRVHTSSEVRDFTATKLLLPFAQGVCDMLSGDVALFRDTGIFEPHVLGHEFTHRKGYFKELHAQVLSYLALTASGEPLLVQAARAERLYRQLRVLAGDDVRAYHDLIDNVALRPELAHAFDRFAAPSRPGGVGGELMKALIDQRLKLTGQNGLSDYDVGFTDFLWTFSQSPSARQDRSLAAA